MEVNFAKAKYSNRIFAFCTDLILMIIAALGLMIGTRAIVFNLDFYKNAYNSVIDIQLKSGLFIEKNSSEVVSLVDYYEPKTTDDFKKCGEELDKSLKQFYSSELFFENTDESYQHYVDLKVESELFIYLDSTHKEAVPVKTDEESLKSMYSFYCSTIKNDASRFIAEYDGYIEATRTINLTSIFIILLIPIVLSVTIFEYLIPLVIGNGRKTLGKLLFKISVVDARGLQSSFARFSLRFLFLLVIEILLSVIAFTIPLIVSFSMFAFSKTNQSLHDYVLNTYVVDSSDTRVFKNEKEYLEAKQHAENLNLRDKNIVF